MQTLTAFQFLLVISFVGYVYHTYYNKTKNGLPPPIVQMPSIIPQNCQSPERNTLDNCACPDQYFDDNIHDECQLCPYPCTNCYDNTPSSCMISEDRLFVSLDTFVSQENIDQLNNYLVNEVNIFDGDFEYKDFTARGAVHSRCIPLKKTLAGTDYGNMITFSQRLLKISDYYWIYNDNAPKLQPLLDFIDSLNVFEFMGEIAIITNSPDRDGIEHTDHSFKNLVSEFIWIRGNRDKQFYVIDPAKKERHFFSSYIGFFDDKLIHSIGTTPMWDYSIRVNGKFKPWVRQFIGEHYTFDHDEYRREKFLDQDWLQRNYTASDELIQFKN